MNLADYWPTEANILQCIKPEAEADWDEVFLAIHQPMRLRKRAFTGDDSYAGQSVDESAFLKEFLKPNLPTGTLLMPILGDSGIGKSHLVRWLDVKLKRRSDAEQRHVIRIPKSSSLKTVLGYILENLSGKQYDQIRRQLKAAREQLDVIGAEERIRGELLAAIRRKFEDAQQNRADSARRGEKSTAENEEWFAHGNPQGGLPALLGDPVTSRMFMRDTKDRAGIISQLARHLVTDSAEDRPLRRVFEDADLTVPDDLEIGKASAVVQRYLVNVLGRHDGRERKTAVRLLNSIIDGALSPLASPSDTSLSELFLQIRRQLLKDGRELVLLVEDFAVLSGIQGALLDAMIREGVRGGVDACVMRTALAVTQGYDFGRYDTVKTRAVYGWYLDEGSDNDEETVGRICDYVGAYLNAARFGVEDLKKIRHEFKDQDWPPRFGAEGDLPDKDRRQLEAFGTSPSGWPLFPFNAAAVRQMADQYLRDGNNRLRLNPRRIINHLLIRILQDHRSVWVDGRFPSEQFLGNEHRKLPVSLQADIGKIADDKGVQQRYLALLRYWGDRPDTLARTNLPPEVYDAFGLKPLRGLSSGVVDRTRPGEPGTGGVPPKPPEGLKTPTTVSLVSPEPAKRSVTSDQPEEVREWERKLNKWTPDSALPQTDANRLRTFLADHVLAAINWDVELLKGLKADDMKGWQGNVFLPSAKGTGNIRADNAMCAVCTDEEFASDDGRMSAVLALIALTRYEHYKGWDYPDAEEDYARLQNLLGRLVPQATEWLLKKKYRGFTGDPIPALVETLLLSARFMNVELAHRSDSASLLEALFTPPPEIPITLPDDEWTHLKRDAAKHHMVLRDELLARTAVRQGGADKEYGIDCVRLLKTIAPFKTTWKISATFPTAPETPNVDEAVHFAKQLPGKLSAAMRKRVDQLTTVRQRSQVELGDDFDKNALVAKLKELIPLALQLSVLTDDLPRAAELQTLCEDFRQAPVTETLERLAASDSSDFGAQLSSLTRIDDRSLDVIHRFVETMSKVLSAVEGKVEAELKAGEGCVQASKDRIELALVKLSLQLDVIGGSPS